MSDRGFRDGSRLRKHVRFSVRNRDRSAENTRLISFSGTPCNPVDDTCGSSSLTTCSPSSTTCTCLPSSTTLVSYWDTFYCADMMNSSNCQIFPSRCITWCNATSNVLCICPSGTLKVQRSNLFVCELPLNASNCAVDDPLRRCVAGQCCANGQCLDCSMTSTSRSSKLTR